MIDMLLLSCNVMEQVMEMEDSVFEYELIGCEIINAAWSDLAPLKSKKDWGIFDICFMKVNQYSHAKHSEGSASHPIS